MPYRVLDGTLPLSASMISGYWCLIRSGLRDKGVDSTVSVPVKLAGGRYVIQESLLPREYNRAAEAIAEGRYCVEQAIPMLRRYCS